jgi:prevent-host-death family protein
VFVHSTNHKGAVAEAAITAHAVRLGIKVLKPVSEHGRYDLAFDLGSKIIRVQCKWAPVKGEVICVHLAGYRLTSRGSVRSTYSADEIDAVAVFCEELERAYLIPSAVAATRYALHLRLGPPRNGQRAAINWAADYELPGAIAQSGERLRGTQEVAGSSPASSTPSAHEREEVVGAHDFRCQFGYWMERAAAGTEVLITRRGRRYARLGPADPRLDIESADGEHSR